MTAKIARKHEAERYVKSSTPAVAMLSVSQKAIIYENGIISIPPEKPRG
jgi:hypothetical protein